MGRATLYELTDRQYLRLDGGNVMAGQLPLAGDPIGPNDAVRKAYLDRMVGGAATPADIAAAIQVLTNAGGTIDVRIAAHAALYLALTGGTMTGVLTLAGAPVNPLEAATAGYVDALDAAQRTYLDNQDALRLLLAGGVMGGLLTLSADPVNVLHAATKQYVDGLITPATLDTYDAVVAAADGDYTSIVTACATEAAGARIFIKAGTYNETADIVMKDGQQLIGENPEDTIIDFGGATRQINSAGGVHNLRIENLNFQNSIDTESVRLGGDNIRVYNCWFINLATTGFGGVYLYGNYGIVENCTFDGFSTGVSYCISVNLNGMAIGNTINNCRGGIQLGSNCVAVANTIKTLTTTQVQMEGSCALVGNILNGGQKIVVAGPDCLIAGNMINGAAGIEWSGAQTHISITGNYFNGSQVHLNNAGADWCLISGNIFDGGVGVSCDGDYVAITGNTFSAGALIELTAGASLAMVSGNQLGSAGGAKIVDSGTLSTLTDNHGVPALLEKLTSYEKNTSGGALVAGDCVVRKAVAAGNEITTTVNQGDDLVCGMLMGNAGDTVSQYVQVTGFTDLLKVNGIVNIAIGDLLGTFTAAGISMKAAAGDMAFAIALEAYVGADSLGVIDAMLITPRKV